jgi:signal transduction histidine kinase
MTTIASRAEEAPGVRWVPGGLGLSGRLILLTVGFVLLAQVIVYLPSVASFRRSWVSDRAMAAQMIALALSSMPPNARSADLDARLLAGIKGAQAIGVRGPGTRWLVANAEGHLPEVRREIDVRESPWWRPLRGALRNLLGDVSPATRVIGPGVPGIPAVEWVELIVDEAPLWRATLDFTRNFVLVSFVISLITAGLLYLALHLVVVAPVKRLSESMAGFAADPEDVAKVISPSGRTDEIGRVEASLARMQTTLAGELRQKRRLADLGLAVSKINHELRNMLTTAQLLGDRLGEVDDPSVRRIAPRLLRTLDRAIAFCGATLAYGRAAEPEPQRRQVRLLPIVLEQLDMADGRAIGVETDIPEELEIDVDPEQIGRVLLNLLRNAVEALTQSGTPAPRIVVSARRRDGAVTIRVADNGPGVPERIRTRLFSAFQSSERSGGTGLGLPVADELVRLHGGALTLEGTAVGATFSITIPDRSAT